MVLSPNMPFLARMLRLCEDLSEVIHPLCYTEHHTTEDTHLHPHMDFPFLLNLQCRLHSSVTKHIYLTTQNKDIADQVGRNQAYYLL